MKTRRRTLLSGPGDAQVDYMDLLLGHPVDGLQEGHGVPHLAARLVDLEHVGGQELGPGQQSAPFWLAHQHGRDRRAVNVRDGLAALLVEGAEGDLLAPEGRVLEVDSRVHHAELDPGAAFRCRLAPADGIAGNAFFRFTSRGIENVIGVDGKPGKASAEQRPRPRHFHAGRDAEALDLQVQIRQPHPFDEGEAHEPNCAPGSSWAG